MKKIMLAAAALLAASCCRAPKDACSDFLSIAQERYAVRSFSADTVSQADLDLTVEAGRVAPTSLNSQPQMVYVVRSEEAVAKMQEITPCMYGAPHCFVFCYEEDRASGRGEDDSWGEVDVTIVLTHMMLEAASLGIGTCPVGRFDPEKLVSLLGIPEGVRPVLVMPFGYPAADAAPSPRHASRRPAEETVKYL